MLKRILLSVPLITFSLLGNLHAGAQPGAVASATGVSASSILSGTNVTVTDNGNGTLTISASAPAASASTGAAQVFSADMSTGNPNSLFILITSAAAGGAKLGIVARGSTTTITLDVQALVDRMNAAAVSSTTLTSNLVSTATDVQVLWNSVRSTGTFLNSKLLEILASTTSPVATFNQGTLLGPATSFNFSTNLTASLSGKTVTITGSAGGSAVLVATSTQQLATLVTTMVVVAAGDNLKIDGGTHCVQIYAHGSTWTICGTSSTYTDRNARTMLYTSTSITPSLSQSYSTKSVLNLPFGVASSLGSSTMAITNSTLTVLNGKGRWDAQSGTAGANSQFFDWPVTGGINASAISTLRQFVVNCSSSAGDQNNIVGAADGLAQTYTLSFATYGANTNTNALVYTNPTSFTMTGACVAGGTREIRDVSLTGLSSMLSNNPTNLVMRATRSGPDLSTTESVLDKGLIEVVQTP